MEENRVHATFVECERRRKIQENHVCKWKAFITRLRNVKWKTISQWRRYVVLKKSTPLLLLTLPPQTKKYNTKNAWKAMNNILIAKKYAIKWHQHIIIKKQNHHQPIKEHVKVVYLMFEFHYVYFFVNNVHHCFKHLINMTNSQTLAAQIQKYMLLTTQLLVEDQTFDDILDCIDTILKSSFLHYLRYTLTLTNNLRKKKSIVNFVLFFHAVLQSFSVSLQAVANVTLPSLIRKTIQKMQNLDLFYNIPQSLHTTWQQEKWYLRMFSDLPQDSVNITRLWLLKSSEKTKGLLQTFTIFCDLYHYDDEEEVEEQK